MVTHFLVEHFAQSHKGMGVKILVFFIICGCQNGIFFSDYAEI